jgi:hypothetical protein
MDGYVLGLMFRFFHKLSINYISIIKPNLITFFHKVKRNEPLSPESVRDVAVRHILTFFFIKTTFFLQPLSQKEQNHTSLGRLHQIDEGS